MHMIKSHHKTLNKSLWLSLCLAEPFNKKIACSSLTETKRDDFFGLACEQASFSVE
jgi:hypothetical protein